MTGRGAILGHASSPRGGLVIALDETDALWLGRAMVGEEGERGSYAGFVAVGSTMIRRLIAIQEQDRHERGLTLWWPHLSTLLVGDEARSINGYCQPVAWQWRTRGPAHLLERRARIRSLAWSELSADARRAATALLTGSTPLSAKTAVHFADSPTMSNSLAQNPSWQVVHVAGAANRFASVPVSRTTAGEVSVRPAVTCMDRLRAMFGGGGS